MTKEEIITTKIMGWTTYIGIVLGTITQDTTLILSAISYIVCLFLGIITAWIKLDEYFTKKRKNEDTTDFKSN